MASDAEIARRGVEALNRGDIEAMIELTDPELRLVPVRSLLEGGEYRGHDGLRQYVADMAEDWRENKIVIDEILEPGHGVLVLGTFRFIGRSGNEVSQKIAWHATYRDEKLLSLVAYTDQESARRDLGLT